MLREINVQAMLQVMDGLGIAPRISTMNCILNCYAAVGLPETILALSERFRKLGYKVCLARS